ncbi:hypothetical protein HDV64DRAFT_253970 [Trichoderma sp. TUCIM 5745]
MTTTTPPVTISAQSQSVRQRFLNLIRLSNENISALAFNIPSTAIVDCLERFSLWAGNMGAMHNPLTPLSLDQRLFQAADIRQQIYRQLDEIEEAIDDLTNMICSPSSNHGTAIDQAISSSIAGTSASDKTSEDSFDEVKITLQIIHECIYSLFRLSMLIRKLSPRDRFKQALLVSEVAFTDSFDIDYVRNKYSKLANSLLSIRLGSGIAKRRNFIAYCRDHRSRLGMEEANIHDTADTELLSSKATTFAPPPNVSLSFQAEEDDNISLASASTMTTSLSNLKLPSLAHLALADQPFECPICFTIQAFQNEKSWKLHAFRDLKAYVCTLGGAECDAELFGDRDSWFEHELQKHRSQYSCILCKMGDFSIPGLQAHIRKTHGDFSDAEIRILQEKGRESPTQFEARDCPFFDEWAEKLLQKKTSGIQSLHSTQKILVNPSRFKRHVASHQEQLAIFALPRANEDEDLTDSDPSIRSDATPTAMAVGEDGRQEIDVERNHVLELNAKHTPPDASGSPSIARKDGILSKGEETNLTEFQLNEKTQATDAVGKTSKELVGNSSLDTSIPRTRKTVPIKEKQNRAIWTHYRVPRIQLWTCVCVITTPSKYPRP